MCEIFEVVVFASLSSLIYGYIQVVNYYVQDVIDNLVCRTIGIGVWKPHVE